MPTYDEVTSCFIPNIIEQYPLIHFDDGTDSVGEISQKFSSSHASDGYQDTSSVFQTEVQFQSAPKKSSLRSGNRLDRKNLIHAS